MKRATLSERNGSKASARTSVIRKTGCALPKQYTRALAVLETRILELFGSGQNTMEIASQVKATEAQVYNILARLGQ